MSKLKLLLVMMLVTVAAKSVFCETLSMEQYLDMVAKNNSQLMSVQANIDAVKGKLAEIERVYSYYLSAGVSYTDDQSGRPYTLALASMQEVSQLNADLSVSKTFATGTQLSLGVQGLYGNYNPINPIPEYYITDIAPFVQLQQSLFKDFNGAVTKANIAQAKASANSALYLLEYQKQGILLNAKMAYWNLSYSRTVVEFRTLSLARTKKILDWNEKRYSMDLAERSDLLQSQAAVKMRELNLKLASENEVKTSREFNQLINAAGEKVSYDIFSFGSSVTDFQKGKQLEKKGYRADVLSAMENVNSASQTQIASKKNLGSDLVLTGQFALNGVDKDFANATKDIGDFTKPTYSIGLRYTMPLDFGLRKTIKEGYESAKVSADKALEFAKIQEENDWQQLLDNWNNAKSRLTLSLEIKDIQQKRNEEDQSLLKKGRTTTYYVLQSEQDLDDATLSVYQNILELISIYEQSEALYNTQKI